MESAWSPPGMQQQTYSLSMGQRQMTRVSMESTRNAATDLLSVIGSDLDDQGRHHSVQVYNVITDNIVT